jgi:hypothetical protein
VLLVHVPFVVKGQFQIVAGNQGGAELRRSAIGVIVIITAKRVGPGEGVVIGIVVAEQGVFVVVIIQSGFNVRLFPDVGTGVEIEALLFPVGPAPVADSLIGIVPGIGRGALFPALFDVAESVFVVAPGRQADLDVVLVILLIGFSRRPPSSATVSSKLSDRRK